MHSTVQSIQAANERAMKASPANDNGTKAEESKRQKRIIQQLVERGRILS